MVGSGKFDRIRIREKGLDPTGSGSATLLVAKPIYSSVVDFGYDSSQLFSSDLDSNFVRC